MTTLVQDYRIKVKSKILCRSNFFKTVIEKDPQVLAKGKAVEIKLTSRKNQVSVETILQCFDYLETLDFQDIEISVKNMLSLLVTSNFLKISSLENYCVEYISSNILASNIVDVANISFQVKNIKLLDKSYM